MQFTKRLHSIACIAAMSAICATIGAAQAGTSKAVDATGSIPNFDILGVKLGMTEAQAVAAIKERFPAGTKDSRGRVVSLKQTDYELQNKATGNAAPETQSPTTGTPPAVTSFLTRVVNATAPAEKSQAGTGAAVVVTKTRLVFVGSGGAYTVLPRIRGRTPRM